MDEAIGAGIALGMFAVLIIFVGTPLLFGGIAAIISYVVLLILRVDDNTNAIVSILIGISMFSIALYTIVTG